MHPQTLRKYERVGFIAPPRAGTLRLYSDEDIAQLRLIKHFVEDLGLNLSGVELALKLTAKLIKVRTQIISQGEVSSDVSQELDGILADALGIGHGGGAAQQHHAFLGARHGERAALLPAGRQASLGFEP